MWKSCRSSAGLLVLVRRNGSCGTSPLDPFPTLPGKGGQQRLHVNPPLGCHLASHLPPCYQDEHRTKAKKNELNTEAIRNGASPYKSPPEKPLAYRRSSTRPMR